MSTWDPLMDSLGTHGPRNEPNRDQEQFLLRMLETHGEREGAALESYEKVASSSSTDGAVHYLVRLILEDERRHHRVFQEMANELRTYIWEVDVEPRLPSMSDAPSPELLAETERLLAFEKQDSKELRHLRSALRRTPQTSLQLLLVDLMLHDTNKHISILEFIRERARASR